MEKTKKEIVIIGLILLMVIALIGVSYAAFRFTGEGTKVNSITTGSITMTYEESDNTISLTGALPTTDKTGKTRLNPGEYFDFTVSSNISGDTNINYEISAKEVGDGTIDGSNIKLYLTRITETGEEELMTPEVYNEEASANNFTGRPSGEMSLYTSSMNSSESNNYRLRMWVDEDYNPQGDGGNLTFSVQINVYGLNGLSMEDRMMRTAASEDFHSSEYQSKITSIVTKGDTTIPEEVIESWDISEKQNGSVIAYVEDDGTGSGTYKVTIGAQDKIIANYDMSSYFSNFSSLSSIELTYLDTSLVTDMTSMFRTNKNLIELDLSNFNTESVTSMEQMFQGCSSLTLLNLTSFNTNKVTNMGGMFYECNKLIQLDLKSFDTKNVTNMQQMFYGCSNLTELDLSNFNTESVTSMEQMFTNCSSLVKLDVSNFNTSIVTNMGSTIGADFNSVNWLGMFGGCTSLTKLDLRSFDTSNATNMYGMFGNTPNLTEVLVSKDKWITDKADTRNLFYNSGSSSVTYI